MKANVMKVVTDCMSALGPVFHEVRDFETIRLAMAVVMAKVIQATPNRGDEMIIHDQTEKDIRDALTQLLEIEANQTSKLAQTIDFSEFARINGHSAAGLVGEPTLDPHLTPHSINPEDSNDVQSAIEEAAQSQEAQDWLARDAEDREPEAGETDKG